jgi:hypothetical protein
MPQGEKLNAECLTRSSRNQNEAAKIHHAKTQKGKSAKEKIQNQIQVTKGTKERTRKTRKREHERHEKVPAIRWLKPGPKSALKRADKKTNGSLTTG